MPFQVSGTKKGGMPVTVEKVSARTRVTRSAMHCDRSPPKTKPPKPQHLPNNAYPVHPLHDENNAPYPTLTIAFFSLHVLFRTIGPRLIPTARPLYPPPPPFPSIQHPVDARDRDRREKW